MKDENLTKCKECNSRDLDRDESRGEIICNDCGTVLDECQIDANHPSGQVGENAHMSAERNDNLGGSTTRRTHFDRREAYKAGMGNIVRADQRAHAKRNERANNIIDEIKRLSGSENVKRASVPIVKVCFTKEGEGDGFGKLPLNQMRYINGQNSTYIIRVCAIATMKVLSEMGRIPYQFWKEDADDLGLDPNDITEAVKLIKQRLINLYRAMKSTIDPRDGKRDARKNALYAFEQRLREYIREHDIEHADELLDWFSERLSLLDSDGDGPMGEEKPNMLLAMITICGLEQFDVKLTKKCVAEDVFLLTVGGVNSRLKTLQFGMTNKQFIKKFGAVRGSA